MKKCQIYILFITLFTYHFLASCGKVTQELPKEKAQITFSLSYEVHNLDTNDPALTPTQNFHILDTLYTSVKGIKDNEIDLVAWSVIHPTAKTIILQQDIPANEASSNVDHSLNMPSSTTISTLNYSIKNFDLKGNSLKSSPYHSQIKAELFTKPYFYEFSTPDVSTEFDSYFIMVFNDNHTYRLRFLDFEDVTGNKNVNIDVISMFDTFQSIIRLTSFQIIDFDNTTISLIKMIYDYPFYNLISFTIPPNTLKEFNPKKPSFEFDMPLINELVSILDMVQDDKQIALEYLSVYNNTLLPPSTIEYIENKIHSLED